MKTHGDRGWESFPSYLDVVVPKFLELLARRNLIITVFVVGQDAALDKNRAALASIANAGHEIGNHSFHHEPWLHLYSPVQIDDEIARAEEAIESATSQRPRGFRGPGYSLSPAVLQTLIRRGYLYDCSTLPTFLGPLARAYYFFTARLTAEQRADRKRLFGKWTEGFRSIAPYRWQLGDERLLEIPVTTMPLFRVPIHVSYLLYLRQFSAFAAWAYWRKALALCRLTGIGPSLLLHPLDFLGRDDEPELAFFPAMRMPGRAKRDFVSAVLESFANQFSVVPMIEHAQRLADTTLPVKRSAQQTAADLRTSSFTARMDHDSAALQPTGGRP